MKRGVPLGNHHQNQYVQNMGYDYPCEDQNQYEFEQPEYFYNEMEYKYNAPEYKFNAPEYYYDEYAAYNYNEQYSGNHYEM